MSSVHAFLYRLGTRIKEFGEQVHSSLIIRFGYWLRGYHE